MVVRNVSAVLGVLILILAVLFAAIGQMDYKVAGLFVATGAALAFWYTTT